MSFDNEKLEVSLGCDKVLKLPMTNFKFWFLLSRVPMRTPIYGRVYLASILTIFLLICSCASLKITPEGRIFKDTFSRTYSMEFRSFHPKANTALQEYARKHKGNSFQIMRLGSDAVVLQGRYKREADTDRFFATITAKPAGAKKTSTEIKISSTNPEASSEYLEKAAGELFRIIEKGAGVHPQE